MRILFSVISILLLPYVIWAQSPGTTCIFTVSGRVLDEHNQEPLAYATLVLKGTSYATLSDSSGNFIINNVCPGKYTLLSTHIGCETVSLPIEVRKNLSLVVLQEHHAEELRNLVITATSKKIEAPLKMSIIDQKELDNGIGKPLAEQLKSIAGVSSLQTGNSISKPVIHGLHSNRIITMNNGVRQEGQQWGSEHGPEIDPFVAQELAVIKGVGGIRYGSDAIGGVVLVNPAELRDSAGYDALVNIAGASNGQQGTANAMINGNLKQLDGVKFRLQGTLKQAGNVKSPDYYLKNTGFNEHNFSAAIAYQKSIFKSELFYSSFSSKIGIFSATHIGNLSDLERAFISPVPLEEASFTYTIEKPYQLIGHDLVKWKTSANFKQFGILTYTVARQTNSRMEYDKHAPKNDSLAALNKPVLSFFLNTLSHELVYEVRLPKNNLVTLGYSAQHQANNYEGRFFIPNFNQENWGVFAIENFSKNKFFSEFGLRYDKRDMRVFISENGFIKQPLYFYSNFSGIVGVGYTLKFIEVRFNLGSGWRAPSVNELYANGVHHGAAAVEIGNKNLVPEQSLNKSFLIETKQLKRISGVLELYHNSIRNFINLVPIQPASLTIRGAFPTFAYQQVNAILQGADATFKFEINKHIHFYTKASYLYAIDADKKERLSQMPQNSIEPGIAYELNDFSQKWSTFSVRFDYALVEQAKIAADNTDYLLPPKGYQLLNISASIHCKIKQQQLQMGLAVNNALNTSYRSYMNRYRYFSDELGRNFMLYLKIPIDFKK